MPVFIMARCTGAMKQSWLQSVYGAQKEAKTISCQQSCKGGCARADWLPAPNPGSSRKED
jgi:hypothetical protein